MATGIEIKVDLNEDEITPNLRRLLLKMGSNKVPLSLMGRALVTSTKKRFQLSRGPVAALGGTGVGHDEPWAPLAAATVARRRKQSSKPLVDTGSLMRSITSHATESVLHVGTNHEIAPGVSAAIHQLGGKAGRGHSVTIPPRPFLGIDAEDKHEMEEIAASYLGSAL